MWLYWVVGIYLALVIIQVILVATTSHWINNAPFPIKLFFIVLSPLFLPITLYVLMQNITEKIVGIEQELQSFISQCEQDGIKFASREDALDVITYIMTEKQLVIFDIQKTLMEMEDEGVVSSQVDEKYVIYTFIKEN